MLQLPDGTWSDFRPQKLCKQLYGKLARQSLRGGHLLQAYYKSLVTVKAQCLLCIHTMISIISIAQVPIVTRTYPSKNKWWKPPKETKHCGLDSDRLQRQHSWQKKRKVSSRNWGCLQPSIYWMLPLTGYPNWRGFGRFGCAKTWIHFNYLADILSCLGRSINENICADVRRILSS